MAHPGQRFGRLTVLREEAQRKDSGALAWVVHCLCDCGQQTSPLVNNLKNGIVESCGCLQRERASESNARRATHGLSDHPHYFRWQNMMGRCYDPTDSHFQNYGARGISVCQEWHDPRPFVAYLDAALGPCPVGHSLDRIDNNGNYEPGNVRWADPVTQRHNQRRGTAWKA